MRTTGTITVKHLCTHQTSCSTLLDGLQESCGNIYANNVYENEYCDI